MKLIISGVEYPLENINEASLDDLMQLRKQTGLGIKGLREQLATFSDGDDPESVLDDPDKLLALGALVWLARRKAGEKLTLEQACAFPLSEMEMLDDEDAQVGEVDPKSLPGSGEPSTTTSQTT